MSWPCAGRIVLRNSFDLTATGTPVR